ncbi:MAG: class I SAM-dependent methyltransferase [Bacteroidota bacterium]
MASEPIDSFILRLKEFIYTSPFEGEVVNEFMSLIAEIHQDKEEGKLSKSNLGLLQKQANLAFPVHTMHGHAIARPRVYSGDFELIDKIYTQYCSHSEHWAAWDRHFHSLPTFIAVRNRKAYFQKLLEKSLSGFSTSSSSFKVLNLLSGSCRPIKEFLQVHNPESMAFDCVEVDRHAIEYASGLLGHLGSSVRFVNQNVFRFKPETTYDLIWAGGLFNYLDDKLFMHMLKHVASWMSPGAKLAIGIVSDTNPNIDYLEVLFDWRVYHRSTDQVISLVKEAGLGSLSQKLFSEPLNAIQFLELVKQ